MDVSARAVLHSLPVNVTNASCLPSDNGAALTAINEAFGLLAAYVFGAASFAFLLGAVLYVVRRREYRGTALWFGLVFVFEAAAQGMLSGRYFWAVYEKGETAHYAGSDWLLYSYMLPGSVGLALMLLVMLHRGKPSSLFSKRCGRAGIWLSVLLVLASAGIFAYGVVEAIINPTSSGVRNLQWTTFGVFALRLLCILVASHGSEALTFPVTNIKGILPFIFLHDAVIGTLTAYLASQNRPHYALVLSAWISLGTGFFPVSAVLISLWPRPVVPRARERPIMGRITAFLQKNAVVISTGVLFYLSAAFLFVWGLVAACFTPSGAALGAALVVARGSARVLLMFTPLLILTILFGVLSALRRHFLHVVLPFEQNLTFHYHTAFIWMSMALLHTASHIYLLAQQQADIIGFGVPLNRFVWPWLSGWIILVCASICFVAGVVYIRNASSSKRFCTFPRFIWLHRLGYALVLITPFHGAERLFAFPFAWVGLSIVTVAWFVEFLVRAAVQSTTTTAWRIKKVTDSFFWLEIVAGRKAQWQAGQWVYLRASFDLLERHPFTIAAVHSMQRESGDLSDVGEIASFQDAGGIMAPRSTLMWNPSPAELLRAHNEAAHLHPSGVLPGEAGSGLFIDEDDVSSEGEEAAPMQRRRGDGTDNDNAARRTVAAAAGGAAEKGKRDAPGSEAGTALKEIPFDSPALGPVFTKDTAQLLEDLSAHTSAAETTTSDYGSMANVFAPTLSSHPHSGKFSINQNSMAEYGEEASLLGDVSDQVKLRFLIKLGSFRGERSWTRRLLQKWETWQREIETLSYFEHEERGLSADPSVPLSIGPEFRTGSFSIHVDGPYSSNASNLTDPSIRHAVFIGIGSGVTAPAALLSWFSENSTAWTAFVFSSREASLVAEVAQFLRSLPRLPAGGCVLYLTDKEYEWPDSRLLHSLKRYTEGHGKLVDVRDTYREWLLLARRMFGRERVSELLRVRDEHSLPISWKPRKLQHLIRLLQNSVRNQSFANPVPGRIRVLRGRAQWPMLLMQLGVAAIKGKCVVPVLQKHITVRPHFDDDAQRQAVRQFVHVHCLYTGHKGAMADVESWINDNNRQIFAGLAALQARTKAKWHFHPEAWA